MPAEVHAAIAVAAFAGAALVMAFRPFGVNDGLAALALGMVEVGVGVVPPPAAARALFDAAPVLAFFAALLMLVAFAGRAGYLDRAVKRVAGLAGASPMRLLVLVLALSTGITAVGTNDATALAVPTALAPFLLANRLPAAPYILGIAFVANSASLILPTSNPATLLALAFLHVSPLAVAGPLLAAGVLATIVTIAATSLLSARSLTPGRMATVVAGSESPAPARRVPWSLLALVAGFALLATGLEQSGVTSTVAALTRGAGPETAGLAAALTANLFNNLPTALAVGSVVPHRPLYVIAVVAGSDLGPNLTPLGSLSNLLILAAARGAGIEVSWRRFMTWGLLIAPLSVGSGLLAARLAAG